MLGADSTYQAFTAMMNTIFNIMKMDFIIFGIKLSFWDVFLWSIVMYALLKLFFALFE